MNKRLGALVIVVAAVTAAAGLLAGPSKSASNACTQLKLPGPNCLVSLTATGPTPSRLEMPAGTVLLFGNPDSVSHTVVFADGQCSLTLTPGEGLTPFVNAVSPDWDCHDDSSLYVGRNAYTVDGKFSGIVVTVPVRRSVTLKAGTHTIRAGTRLTLHGLVTLDDRGASPPAPVIVLARHNSTQPFEPVATVRTRGSHDPEYGWALSVRPHVTTTYIAEVTGQRQCYFPASRCAHPQGQFWADPKSSPFTVRIRR